MPCQDPLTLQCDSDPQLFAWFWRPVIYNGFCSRRQESRCLWANMKCTKLSASKHPFFLLLCCLCGVFTAPCVLQWILTCRYLAGHGALRNTMDSELRCRIASIYEAIMSRHNLAGHDPLKTQWFLNVEAESLQYTRRSSLPACRVASWRWEKWLLACWWPMLVLTLR